MTLGGTAQVAAAHCLNERTLDLLSKITNRKIADQLQQRKKQFGPSFSRSCIFSHPDRKTNNQLHNSSTLSQSYIYNEYLNRQWISNEADIYIFSCCRCPLRASRWLVCLQSRLKTSPTLNLHQRRQIHVRCNTLSCSQWYRRTTVTY